LNTKDSHKGAHHNIDQISIQIQCAGFSFKLSRHCQKEGIAMIYADTAINSDHLNGLDSNDRPWLNCRDSFCRGSGKRRPSFGKVWLE